MKVELIFLLLSFSHYGGLEEVMRAEVQSSSGAAGFNAIKLIREWECIGKCVIFFRFEYIKMTSGATADATTKGRGQCTPGSHLFNQENGCTQSRANK